MVTSRGQLLLIKFLFTISNKCLFLFVVLRELNRSFVIIGKLSVWQISKAVTEEKGGVESCVSEMLFSQGYPGKEICVNAPGI